jgi:hypothetical protein
MKWKNLPGSPSIIQPLRTEQKQREREGESLQKLAKPRSYPPPLKSDLVKSNPL